MNEYRKSLQEYCSVRLTQLLEPVNELETMTEKQSIMTLSNCIQAVKHNSFIVGSCSAEGSTSALSFARNPVVHGTAQSARSECARLAKLYPGKLYVFVQFSGGEMLPQTQTVSI